MQRRLLNPKIDFVFKKIFGSEKHPRVLISFLNAILKPINPISNVEIRNSDLEKEFLDDKFSRLDIKARTNKNEIINIEIQLKIHFNHLVNDIPSLPFQEHPLLKNEYNMIKRSLYYWSKMYEEQLNEGDDYSKLEITICINILNFKYLDNNRFHNGYRLKEIETNEELTNIQEIHFIEIPKLSEDSDEKDMLVAWMEFLKNPESEKVRSLELTISEIREAKDELIRISNDKEQRLLYEMRSKTLKDKNSALNEAERKGIEKGIEKGYEAAELQNIKNLMQKLKMTAEQAMDMLDIASDKRVKYSSMLSK